MKELGLMSSLMVYSLIALLLGWIIISFIIYAPKAIAITFAVLVFYYLLARFLIKHGKLKSLYE